MNSHLNFVLEASLLFILALQEVYTRGIFWSHGTVLWFEYWSIVHVISITNLYQGIIQPPHEISEIYKHNWMQ